MKYLNTYENWSEFGWNKTKPLSPEETVEMIKKINPNFSFDDYPIYRSMSLDENVHFYMEISKEENRESRYSSNQYTLLMNNLPSWRNFPKRQLICSNLPFSFNRYI